jgi:hypothetical protein
LRACRIVSSHPEIDCIGITGMVYTESDVNSGRERQTMQPFLRHGLRRVRQWAEEEIRLAEREAEFFRESAEFRKGAGKWRVSQRTCSWPFRSSHAAMCDGSADPLGSQVRCHRRITPTGGQRLAADFRGFLAVANTRPDRR